MPSDGNEGAKMATDIHMSDCTDEELDEQVKEGDAVYCEAGDHYDWIENVDWHPCLDSAEGELSLCALCEPKACELLIDRALRKGLTHYTILGRIECYLDEGSYTREFAQGLGRVLLERFNSEG
jgi:hypothetical protein